MPLRLAMGFSDNPRVQPLKDGLVKPQGIELDCITLDPSNLFQRNLRYDEFDVSEMSISETERSARRSYQFCTAGEFPGPIGATWLAESAISLPAV